LNILIDTIRVAGFRGIKEIEVSLPRITLLIGMNNSGKTSLLKALNLALGDYSRHLSEEDFYISNDRTPAPEILVDIKILPVDDHGERTDKFNEAWQEEFQDRIQSEANSHQYVGLRTRSKRDEIKGGFKTSYSVLRKWTDINNWLTENVEAPKTFARLTSILFIPIDAQRDIHQEIREKSSLVGKVLSSVKYDETEVSALEQLIKEVNDLAITKSSELSSLKTNLNKLSNSFEISGRAEITPFPRKIRDLSKYFSAHFGESEHSTFSMEYHGMGTRSWASILIVKAFTELQDKKYQEAEKPFFPILAAEEPEAHLHPNAQKTLYRQLEESKGQIIISTHSPYVAATADPIELRYLKKINDKISVRYLSLKPNNLDDKESRKFDEECRKLRREVIHSRGEILFSKAIILCEGETEEQALPLLFEKYFEKEAFAMGVNFIGVGGSGEKYLPFLTFGRDFDIPVFIFSDGEPTIVQKLTESYKRIHGEIDIKDCPNITILDGDDIEGYLLSSGFQSVIESVICQQEGDAYIERWKTKNQGQPSKKNKPIKDYTGTDGHEKALLGIIDHRKKTKYAPLIAKKLCELEKEALPPKILEFFRKLENGGIK
jgi:putative ATP-dependent endonuclease of OLD family